MGVRLFISTVTNEFLTCRQRLSRDLRFPGVTAENQDEYVAKLAAGHSILLKIDDYIAGCDAVIHLIGSQTSTDGRAASKDAVDDLLRRYADFSLGVGLTEAELRTLSYTQWEAWLAYYHIKKTNPNLRLLLATPSYAFVPDHPPDPATATDQGDSQVWHAAALRKRARYPEIAFADERDLSIEILRALRDLLPAQEPYQKIAPSRLVSRHTASDFLGREDELALLDDAWSRDATVNVFCIIAWGGVGKTALLGHWVRTRFIEKGWLDADGRPDPIHYFDWTFYDQGTRSDDDTRAGVASVDTLFDQALTFFGDPDPTRPGKGARLAALVQAHRCLLVLDGLEPLQYPPNHPQAGQITDPDLCELLRTLTQKNPGLCLVSSRQVLTDLHGAASSAVPQHDLEELPEDVAIRLLRKMQVTGSDDDLALAARDYDGHALSLILLGRYIFVAKGGDIRKRDTIPFEKANKLRNAQTRNAWHVLEAYEQWLASPGGRPEEVQALRLVGLFDRPASPGCLAALRAAPAIPGLTEHLVPLDDDEWNALLHRLHATHLLSLRIPNAGEDSHAPLPEARHVPVDAHPLIREYFAKQLRKEVPEAFVAAHSRLFDHLCATTPYQPDTLEDLQPLYQAVTHGCLAGRQQEALAKVYGNRILRGTGDYGFYSRSKLGAIGADLGALAAFFDELWTRPSPHLSPLQQSWVLSEAAFSLRALGRLTEALDPMQESLQRSEKAKEWLGAGITAGNLSELQRTLGDVRAAITQGRRAIDFAERSGEEYEKIINRAIAAAALHQIGSRNEAGELFAEAERMQAEIHPSFPLLYSVRGFQYTDWLLAPSARAAWRSLSGVPYSGGGISLTVDTPQECITLNEKAFDACAEAERRATESLKIAFNYNLGLLDIALNLLTLARAALCRALLAPNPPALAALPAQIEEALGRLRAANFFDHLPEALLTASLFQGTLGGDASAAGRLLNEAQQIAERGPMPLYLADVHLHRARLFRDRTALAKARTLIDRHGYDRRREELADAEAAAAGWPS